MLRGGVDQGEPYVFGYFMDVQRMVRDDRWKLITYPKAAREQLFDLAADPLEQHDLAADPAYAPRLARRRRACCLAAGRRDPLPETRLIAGIGGPGRPVGVLAQIRRNSLLRYIQKRISQRTSSTAAPWSERLVGRARGRGRRPGRGGS